MSATLGTASKLILCAVMLRGRHRGLPAAIDPSVLLPSERSRQRQMEQEFRAKQQAIRKALATLRDDVGNGQDAAAEDPDCPPGMA